MGTDLPGTVSSPWVRSYRADPYVAAFADRHYSRKTLGATQFAPPGRIIVLRAAGAVWVSLSPRPEYVDHAWPGAWNNTLFRNEGHPLLSSELIRAAVAATRWEWGEPPPLGMLTFIDPTKVRHKRDPGRCYRKAGFAEAGRTKSGHIALLLAPELMPEPLAAVGSQGRLFEAQAV